MVNELEYRVSKKVLCHLDLTGKNDRIVCICGKYSDIDFSLSKVKKKQIVLDFVKTHKNCK